MSRVGKKGFKMKIYSLLLDVKIFEKIRPSNSSKYLSIRLKKKYTMKLKHRKILENHRLKLNLNIDVKKITLWTTNFKETENPESYYKSEQNSDSKIQNQLFDSEIQEQINNGYGTCCFCREDCNICSQACGRCARNGGYL
ncbi:MAG: hypothetical protein QXW79_00500 [Thermoplasmata archaeon]